MTRQVTFGGCSNRDILYFGGVVAERADACLHVRERGFHACPDERRGHARARTLLSAEKSARFARSAWLHRCGGRGVKMVRLAPADAPSCSTEEPVAP